jgi:putative hemolysin
MKLSSDITPPFHEDLHLPEGPIIADTLLKIFNYFRLNKVYTETSDKDPVNLINILLDHLDLKYEIPDDDINNIPDSGPFITVSNHPYRGIDSMLLIKIISQKRKDLKIFGSYLLHEIEPLRDIIIPVNTYESDNRRKTSLAGIKEAISHLNQGHPIAIFPAGEQSTHIEVSQVIVDELWQTPALKFIRKSSVPVIPVYFHGTNSRMYHIMGKIHPLLRTANLPQELLKKKNRVVKVRIGSPLQVREQAAFKDISQYGRYLRARTYSLGSAIEIKNYFKYITLRRKHKPEALAERLPSEILADEFSRVREEFELFSTKNYSVVCAPAASIPNIFNEIGRSRERTFRRAGEGTNKSIDIDEYDFYFYHLFIWDTEMNMLVGAYRLGKGKEIMALYGIKGFYISSLFTIKKGFHPVLSQAIELGRSFITEEYQKKAIPLFLLWRGIMVFLLRNTEYRYLIGPVSISNDFSQFSKSLIVEFIRKYFTNDDLASNIVPRKNFVVKNDKATDRNIIIDTSERDINKIEKIIMDAEPGYRLPVLLKKYLELNGRIIGFNIDPDFNYCLDGLLILDLYDVPVESIQGLSRELNDPSILERFNK